MAKRDAVLSESYSIDIDKNVFNEIYLPYLEKIHRYMVFYGGAGSGKSKFISQMLALQLTTMSGRNLICMRKQKTDCVDSVFPEIYGSLKDFGLLDLWKVREHPEPRLTNRLNGNEMVFTGVDDIENIKSVKFKNGNVTDFFYEEASEENSVKVIRELDRRLRDFKLKSRIILSFNPVSRSHWLFDFVTKELNGTDSVVLRTTYKDNRFLPDEYKEVLEKYKYTDPYAYQVYALGEWGTTGQTVFNANLIESRKSKLMQIHLQTPPTKGEFKFLRAENGLPNPDTFEFFDFDDGETSIYKFPQSRVPYVLAFDTAGEGSDYYAGHVFDNVTKEQVAVYHSQKNPDICVLQLFGLAKMYNNALVCPEINFDSYPLKKFQELGYDNFYRRMNPSDSIHERTEPKYGFRTTSENRQSMLSDLVSWTNENMNKLNDVETLNEMLSFTRQQKKMKGIWWGAEAGSHDDLVISAGIALQAMSQQYSEVQPERGKLDGFWTDLQLDLAVMQGRVDNEVAEEYKRSMQERKKAKGLEKRNSRYAR